MILEPINTYMYLTLKRTLANHVDQIQKQKSACLHYWQYQKNRSNSIDVLLMRGYHEEPIAAGSITKQNFARFNEIGQKFKRNCIHKSWLIIGQTDRDTDRAKSKAVCDCIYTKRNEPAQ